MGIKKHTHTRRHGEGCGHNCNTTTDVDRHSFLLPYLLYPGVSNVQLIRFAALRLGGAWWWVGQLSLRRCCNAADHRLLLGVPRPRDLLRPHIHGLERPRDDPRAIGRHNRRARNVEFGRPRAAEGMITVHRAHGERCVAERTPSHSSTTTETTRNTAQSHCGRCGWNAVLLDRT